MIIKSAFLVPFLPRKSISLPSKATEARFAVGEIFFAVDERAAGSVDAADDDAAAAEMIPQVIFDQGIRRAVP